MSRNCNNGRIYKLPGKNNAEIKSVRFIDLFCGIGGFRQALQSVASANGLSSECVFSSDIDSECQKTYHANFGDMPIGDITQVREKDIPRHDILLAGFPCQPFSICGGMKGFEDTRGTLFFDIVRILKEKKPEAFLLENVKLLVGHDGGRTITLIMQTLAGLGYHADYKVLNALSFGLPQKRERVLIAGFKTPRPFTWPEGGLKMKPLNELLESNVHQKYYASETIKKKRLALASPAVGPTIWHENKSGHVSVYPYSCALRAGASYNYLLVNGERRLTPREMHRLQGFPDSFKIVSSDFQARKQAGNSVPVPIVAHVLKEMFTALEWKTATPAAPRSTAL